MTQQNKLIAAPPYSVEQALVQLGTHLKTARIRRRLTIKDVSHKIGTGVRAVSDAEKGKPSTSIAVYTSLLWVYGLLGNFGALADPNLDLEGQALALTREKKRVRQGGGMNNDF